MYNKLQYYTIINGGTNDLNFQWLGILKRDLTFIRILAGHAGTKVFIVGPERAYVSTTATIHIVCGTPDTASFLEFYSLLKFKEGLLSSLFGHLSHEADIWWLGMAPLSHSGRILSPVHEGVFR